MGILDVLGIKKETPIEKDIIQDEDDIIVSAFTRRKYFIKVVPKSSSDEEIRQIVDLLVEKDPVMLVSFSEIPEQKRITFAAQLKSAILNIPDRDFKVFYIKDCGDTPVILIVPGDYEIMKL